MISLFCTDLDDNLLGNPAAAQRFYANWSALPADRRPALVYSTARKISEVHALISEGMMPSPDVIIGESGATLEDLNDPATTWAFQNQFSEKWDLGAVETQLREIPFLSPEARPAPNPLKSSWYLEDATRGQLQSIAVKLQSAGIQATLVYSCYSLLDIVPGKPDKGTALTWLCQQREIPLRQVLVAGDNGTDKSMFVLPNVARLVTETTLSALRSETARLTAYASPASDADGLIDGLNHFGVIESSHRFVYQSA